MRSILVRYPSFLSEKTRDPKCPPLSSLPEKRTHAIPLCFLVNLGSTFPGLKGIYTGISCVALAGLFFAIYASSEYVQYRRRHINGDKVRLAQRSVKCLPRCLLKLLSANLTIYMPLPRLVSLLLSGNN